MGSKSHTKGGIFVDLTLQGVQTRFLLDTGPNITVISPSLFACIADERKPHLVEAAIDLTVADGRSLPMLGKGSFQINLGSTTVKHEVWVAGIDLDGILGLDFMQKHGCELLINDTNEYRLSIQGEEAVCHG